MEIERLPFGQSHADKIRAAHYKWVGMPPGIPPQMADEFMEKLSAGSTIRKLTGGGKLGPPMVSYDRFKNTVGCIPFGPQKPEGFLMRTVGRSRAPRAI
jgi:hypothetical protein